MQNDGVSPEYKQMRSNNFPDSFCYRTLLTEAKVRAGNKL